MKMISNRHPALAQSLAKLNLNQLIALVSDVVSKISAQFARRDISQAAIARIGNSLSRNECVDMIRQLRQLAETLDAEADMKNPDKRFDADSKEFREARYAYALSLALEGIDHNSIDEILYELAFSNEDENAFLEDVYRMIVARST
jgi:hypothetical protein